jgi:hypothetical protein
MDNAVTPMPTSVVHFPCSPCLGAQLIAELERLSDGTAAASVTVALEPHRG